MKKLLAVLLCAVMMTVMVPTFFASAAELPFQQEAVVVAADGEGGEGDSGQVDNSLVGPLSTLLQFFELWGGLFTKIFGEDFLKNIGPALKQLLSIVSLGEFIKAVQRIWKDILGR